MKEERIFKALQNIDCDDKNVKKICEEVLADFDWDYGTSKIVVKNGCLVYKKIYGEPLVDEERISIKADIEGVLDFFCSCICIDKESKIYQQEAVQTTLNDFVHFLPEKIPYGALRIYYQNMGLQQLLYRSDCCVLYYLFKQHTLDEILKLQEFVVKYDLTDLNFYNAGFTKRGALKFFDFSGLDNTLENLI